MCCCWCYTYMIDQYLCNLIFLKQTQPTFIVGFCIDFLKSIVWLLYWKLKPNIYAHVILSFTFCRVSCSFVCEKLTALARKWECLAFWAWLPCYVFKLSTGWLMMNCLSLLQIYRLVISVGKSTVSFLMKTGSLFGWLLCDLATQNFHCH